MSTDLIERYDPPGVIDGVTLRGDRPDRKLNYYRAALEAGTDPQLIAGWTRQVQAERDAAAGQLRAMEAPQKPVRP
ncbi:hypothetical protein [Nocardia brasiliensis]|uniref:hypothetical protein n=1 Tax=Nocardia brasiliensis TaxID=37326 RepID=UPI0024584BA7|nr:hypothetical protein [Nocardia brasiliensis]